MRVYRRRYKRGSRYYTFIQLQPDGAELALLHEARLMNIKIHTHAGSLAGSRLSPLSALQVFQTYVNRIRNRWNVAVTRTTGSVFIDTIILYFKALGEVLRLVWRVFFGTRKRLSSLVRGLTFSSSRVEDLKDIETFVFTSIAAAHHAIAFARNAEREDYFDGQSYRAEIAGLTFAGAPGAIQGTQDGGFDAARGGGRFPEDEDEEFEDTTEVAEGDADAPDLSA